MSDKSNDAFVTKELKKLIDIVFYTFFLLSAVSLAGSIRSHSLILWVATVDMACCFFVHVFSFAAIRFMMRPTLLKHTYGTGKLENFSGFLYGALSLPGGIILIWFGIQRLIHPRMDITFGLPEIIMIIKLIRAFWLFLISRRITRQTGSPIAEAYQAIFKADTLDAFCVVIVLLINLILAIHGHHLFTAYADAAASLVGTGYLLYLAVGLIRKNFLKLIDFQISENEQLRILRVLTDEFPNYQNIGNILTRRSGRRVFVDIEIFFDAGTSVAQIDIIQGRMYTKLIAVFPDLSFNILPKPYPVSGQNDGAKFT